MNDDSIRHETRHFCGNRYAIWWEGWALGWQQEKILSGTFQVPDEVDEWAARLIPHLARVPGVMAVDVRLLESLVMMQSHQEGWAREGEDVIWTVRDYICAF